MTTITQTTTKIIDIHSHILFELDDGSKNIDMSIEMLKQAKSAKINKIICTPHIKYKDDCKFEQTKENFTKLKQIAREIGIELYLGNEILINSETIDMILEKKALSLNNTSFILVELKRNEDRDIKKIINDLEEIIDLGYNVILAHPELYDNYLKIKYIKELKKKNILLQIDASSILKKKTAKKNCKFAKKLLKRKLVDFMASDCHRDDKRNYLDFYEGYKKALKKYDKEYIHTICYDNPLCIIGGNDENI